MKYKYSLLEGNKWQCSCMLTAGKELLHHTVTSVSYKEDSIGQRSTIGERSTVMLLIMCVVVQWKWLAMLIWKLTCIQCRVYT